MNFLSLLLPLLFVGVFSYALFRRVKLYDCFAEGVRGAIPLVVSLFPYLAAILILSELFLRSGLSSALSAFLSPAFRALGIPEEIAPLVLVKPFSGSGSTALLSELLASYGADSYVGRCACVCYGSSETVFYISAVYFASVREKKLFLPVVIALAANFVGVIAGCFFCRFL